MPCNFIRTLLGSLICFSYLLLISGCGVNGGDENPTATPTPTATPSPTLTPTPTPTPTLSPTPTPQPLWAKQAGGTGSELGSDISTLSDGSCLVTGVFDETATFGAGESHETSLTSAGSFDIYVARYNADGALAWAKRAGGTGADYGQRISALSDGSCLVTGYFETTATFGAGESHETSLTSAGKWDIFIARYNPDGTLAWAKRAGGTDIDFAYGISALSDGSCLVTGYFIKEPATFGAGEANETTLTSAGAADIFIARYNPDGTLAWAKRAGGVSSDCCFSISALSDGSCLMTGNFYGETTFGAGEARETSLTTTGLTTWVARYNPDGALAWAKQVGGMENQGYGISALSDGSCLVTGIFSGTATFGPGETSETSLTAAGEWDIYIARYNADGAFAWAKRAGGTSSDYGRGISALSDGSCLVTGYFNGTAAFGTGESHETSLTSAGKDDIWVARYNPDGALAWAKRAGGTEMDFAYGISALSDGSCLVTGFFGATAAFGAGEPHETSLTSAGEWDIFIARYNPDGTLASLP